MMIKTDLSQLTVSKVICVSRSAWGPPRREDRDLYACQLVLRLTGTTEFITPDATYHSDERHVVFLPKGCSYVMTSSGKTDSVWVDFELVDTGAPLGITSYEVQNVQELLDIFERMEHKRIFKKPAYRTYSIAALYEMFAKIIVQTEFTVKSGSKYNVIKPAVKYLEKHYSDPDLNNQALADAAGISEVYLRKLFSAVFGTTPAKYIANVRMEKAKTMLTGEVRSIGEVAEAVGYNNIYYFSKAFKHIVGMTPTKYAKQENT